MQRESSCRGRSDACLLAATSVLVFSRVIVCCLSLVAKRPSSRCPWRHCVIDVRRCAHLTSSSSASLAGARVSMQRRGAPVE